MLAARTGTFWSKSLELAFWSLALVLVVSVTAPVAQNLFHIWRGNSEVGHAPLVLVICLGLIWSRREKIRAGRPDAAGGMLLLPAAVIYLTGFRADIEFFQALGLLLLLGGMVWLSRGAGALRALLGPLGLLALVVPWPTSVTEQLSFPLQVTSTNYAALLCGLLGQRVQQSGVQLALLPETGHSPLYSILVSRSCSGLTSLHVLLTLGYLLAYFTPVRWPYRAALLAATFPTAVLANSLRVSFVLLAGAHWGDVSANWVHDHEAPVLISLCGVLLIGLRAGVLAVATEVPRSSLQPGKQPATAGQPRRPWLVPLFLAFFLSILIVGREVRARERSSAPDFLNTAQLSYRHWKETRLEMSSYERAALQPDSVLIRQFTSGERQLELTVIAGRDRRTLHSPGSCLVGCGWERLSERQSAIPLPRGNLPFTRVLMGSGSRRMLVSYFFTDGLYSAPSLLKFQARALLQQLRGGQRMQAVIRVISPVNASLAEAEELSDDFIQRVVPGVLTAVRGAPSE